ncbi:uncharacterized protein mymx isoform X2 [Gouania willdenowi]|uniref:uncharacterized protein mymx isoform X2 n=1 Tax=Gouania willdenowi TaxID=441366 RepID=UPI001054E154|nr:uncharacterized protein LOC114476777 isoform X2 [Gouania willdenowi]
MSESIVRKVQPFTIGTRLSVPAVPKCQEYTQSYLPNDTLDNCVIQHNLNSLYLSRSQLCARGPCLVSPNVKQPVKHNQEHMAAEDHLNQNVASSSSAMSRSIKKITISGSKDRSETTVRPGVRSPSENNNNNNNISTSTSDSHQPRMVGVSRERLPNSQFKVLLRKDSSDESQAKQEQTWVKLNGKKVIQQDLVPEVQRKDGGLHTQRKASASVTSQSDCITHRISVFNKEVLQAEAWIKGKLQDLKDGCNIQCCPLQDWEEAAQTLQRDLKDFENTLIQLNQMGEQLLCKLNPTSDVVKKQLSHLREQWQSLKQMAANQTKALGGAKNLQEFNKKADKLETWIKEKQEEGQSLVNVLEENVDKMQLTKKMLDLKQDEQLHRNLHEEINSLALKLEKQGKTDGKNISSRRKHINKMWLKVQSHLKNYHENLHLALEVSSFYQQADDILIAMNSMKKTSCASKELDTYGDIRDIASKVMMLDVSVSQVSHLHPALAAGVTQKQKEVKDCWALLQKVYREDADPLTLTREPHCNMGTETNGIMGKEVKEEQNRLKGSVNTIDSESGRQTQRVQNQEEQTARDTPPPGEDGRSSTAEADVRCRSIEKRKTRAESKPASASPGHPQLQSQLQKFTVSADKTLSWLKDNVSMATQVCSIASSEGLEAAKKCQQALEKEIHINRARIEVVKREGYGLVRAQHPGGTRIEEFLGQLEVLWEELRWRHQRNGAFLKASEELGFRVVMVLQALGNLDAWLESVELSMKESALSVDPKTMSRAERESCLLESEVAARSLELSALREEVDRLHALRHQHTQGLPARMEEVERKYHRVQSALTHQSSELQDTRMLTEFLERVELEESQQLSSSRHSLHQNLQTETCSAPNLLGLHSSNCGGGGGEPTVESMGDPVEELREAVEMLNDTVRERGRSQSHDQAIQALLCKHASLAVRMEELLCNSKELSLDILEKETDMAVQCEPERCGLGALQEKQDHLEIDCEILREEVKEMEEQASQLKKMCPERMHILWAKVQAMLQAERELGQSVTENKSHLKEFVQCQDFFRSYLSMISWTEDTRSSIFSDTALHLGRNGQRPLASELDMQIEQKFEEFDALAATGKNLLDNGHPLTPMVGERIEELRSMLGWISVHWRAQKQQRLHRNSRVEDAQDNIYYEAAACPALPESSLFHQKLLQSQQPQAASSCEDTTMTVRDIQPSSPLPGHVEQHNVQQSEDGYEVMNRIGPAGDSPLADIVLLKDNKSPPTGGTVNLILSFGKTGDSQVTVLDPPTRTKEEISEPLHRVSTYLHVKDTNVSVSPVYESISLPRLKGRPAPSASPTFMLPSSIPSSLLPASQTNNVTFHPSTINSTGSIFSSLKRMGKKRKRKRDTRRHTIQKIMGVEDQTDTIPYDTHTWPLKEGRRRKSSIKNDGVKALAYMKNPLLKDIDTDCSGEYCITPYAVSAAGPSTGEVRSHCRFLSLGSVLSFDLPKDMTLIPSIQDIITIAPPESRKGGGADADPLSQRHTILSSFRQTRPTAATNTSPGVQISEQQPSVAQTKQSFDDKCFQHSLKENEDQTVLCNDLPTPHFTLYKDHEQEWDKMSEIPTSAAEKIGNIQLSQQTHAPIYVNQCPTSTPAAQKHMLCPSVHTQIRDLDGHLYHKCLRDKSAREGNQEVHSNQATQMTVNLKSTLSVNVRQDSTDSGISTSSNIKLCSEAPYPDGVYPKAVVGKIVSFEVGGIDCTDSNQNSAQSLAETETEPIQLDHKLFQEVEEELEDIWNQTTKCRESICSDIMYQSDQRDAELTHQSGTATSDSQSGNTSPGLYRNLITASAPNLLVAEFKLPSDIQSLLSYDKGLSPKSVLHPFRGNRRSWAAFPNREPTSKTSMVVNETTSDPVKLPDVGDDQRYIYQYKEDEEEEEEGKVGGKADENTSCLKDQSMSQLSVHMKLDEAHQQRSEDEEQLMTTRERCFSLKPELHSMEGTLERKQKLQLGGKKAFSRGWNCYHAVLFRNTLCFYQQRKDTLRSSACGLPLNLAGSECSPVPDYNKKPNCFRLRLRDGSEYLFNTPSRFMMKKWIMKIQASTGQREFVSPSPVDQQPALSLKPSFCCSHEAPPTSHCSPPKDVTWTFPRNKPLSSSQTKEIVVLTREFSHMTQSDDDEGSLKHTVTQRLSGGLKDICSPPLASCGQDWLSTKRRSHSFTSATFQKIKPVLQTPGGKSPERGSNYCVTLVVGDKSSISPSRSRSSEPPLLATAGWQQDPHHSSPLTYTSLPRPPNKSVFKKIFGKKDF